MLLGPWGSETTKSRAEKKGQSSVPVLRKPKPSYSPLLFAGLNCMGLEEQLGREFPGFSYHLCVSQSHMGCLQKPPTQNHHQAQTKKSLFLLGKGLETGYINNGNCFGNSHFTPAKTPWNNGKIVPSSTSPGGPSAS